MKLNELMSRLFFVLMLSSFAQIGFSQLNPKEIYISVVKNTSDTLLISSFGALQVPGVPDDGSTAWNYLTNNLYEFIYTPNTDYSGTDIAHVQYRKQGTNNQHPIDFITIHYEVVNSIVHANTDYITIDKNQSDVTIEVLNNDNTTGETIDLIASNFQVINGITSVIGNNIQFTPNADFVGMAYVIYAAVDNMGSTKQGVVNINVVEPLSGTTDTIHLTANTEDDLLIPLSSSSYLVDNSTDLFGQVSIEDSYMIYTPLNDGVGEDIILVSDDDNNTRMYIITTVDKVHDYGFVRDDVFYTSISTPISFDVLANDLKNNYPIVEYSDDLVAGDNNGEFVYNPSATTQGNQYFEYMVWNGFEFQTGKIRIVVDDFKPAPRDHYNFATVESTPVLIRYDVPLDNNYFVVKTNPSHGTVEYVENYDDLSLSCQLVSGERSVIYYPEASYVGTDEFELEYCVTGQSECETINVIVEMVASSVSCPCVDNCVWPGDANNDGNVRVDDLLAIAYNMGEIGENRADLGSDSWLGETSNNWNSAIFNESLNSKFSDSDGDGMITIADTTAIKTNYSSTHDLIKSEVLTIADFPWQAIPQSTTLDSGDLWIIDIVLGTDAFPVIDLHGISFLLTLPGDKVDSSTLKLNFFEDSWFTGNSPSVQMSQIVGDGRIEAAFGRTNRIGTNGEGIIGQAICIIEDDLDGTRLLSDGPIPMRIKITGATAINGLGEHISLPDIEAVSYLNRSKKIKSNLSDKLLNYPNPTNDVMNLHFNGNNVIESISVFDMQGRRMSMIDNLNTNHYRLPTSGLHTGLYVLKVKSVNGVVSKKFEVVR